MAAVPQIRNVSPLGELVLPVLDKTVALGEEIRVDDEQLAAALLAQVGVWEPANAAARALLPTATTTAQEG